MLLEPLFLDVVEAGPGDDREGYEGDADVVVGDGPQRVVVLLARRVAQPAQSTDTGQQSSVSSQQDTYRRFFFSPLKSYSFL